MTTTKRIEEECGDSPCGHPAVISSLEAALADALDRNGWRRIALNANKAACAAMDSEDFIGAELGRVQKGWDDAKDRIDEFRVTVAHVHELAATKFHRYQTRDMGDAYYPDGVDDVLEEIRESVASLLDASLSPK